MLQSSFCTCIVYLRKNICDVHMKSYQFNHKCQYSSRYSMPSKVAKTVNKIIFLASILFCWIFKDTMTNHYHQQLLLHIQLPSTFDIVDLLNFNNEIHKNWCSMNNAETRVQVHIHIKFS